MTQPKIQLPANLPEATTLQRIRQFLLTNGYYELESTDTLRFKTINAELGYKETPSSVPHELVFSMSDSHIFYKFVPTGLLPYKDWMQCYVELLMQKMQKAIASGDINNLDLASLEKEAETKLAHPIPKWATILKYAVYGLAFVLVMDAPDSEQLFGFVLTWQFWVALGLVLTCNLYLRFRYRRLRFESAHLPNSSNK